MIIAFLQDPATNYNNNIYYYCTMQQSYLDNGLDFINDWSSTKQFHVQLPKQNADFHPPPLQ